MNSIRPLVAAVAFLPTLALGQGKVEFNRDVRPILSNHCFRCHGPDAATREANLRLDHKDSATSKAESGNRAIVPGDPAASEIIGRITAKDVDDRMPPKGGKPLNDKQIAILKNWITQGADYSAHWAFSGIKRPNVPTMPKGLIHNSIDRFVLRRLESEGLQAAKPATRETLIRRVAYDLTGLPPTIKEIDHFLADKSDRAYARMVDHYLKSPAYGEHMARHWLDLARYADTNGYQYDTEREQWVWRDWVIHAYNRNMPFDQFTIEQLAGDLLPDATPQQRLATGFNRNHGITIEGGIIDEEYRTEYVMDRLVTTGQVWMGLTIGCARCHDHKFDPISQKEFYGLYAFFNQVPERGMRGFTPSEKIPSPLTAQQHQALDDQIQQLRLRLKKVDLEGALNRWAKQISSDRSPSWQILDPQRLTSSGGSKLEKLDDKSFVAGGANPRLDTYTVEAQTNAVKITAVRLEALMHKSLPGGGPGRHSNSNFVLSEFELTAISIKEPSKTQVVKFRRAVADYSQRNYEVAKAIDGKSGNSGWAVDGPTRKKPATAMFVADQPFGFTGGTLLRFRLRHEASFATHGIGRPRLSISSAAADQLRIDSLPAAIVQIAAKQRTQRTKKEHKSLMDYFLAHHHPHRRVLEEIAGLEARKSAAFPATMIMRDSEQLRKTFVLKRGQYDQPTVEVSASVPAVFPKLASTASPNRLDFARWLVSDEHPLTARVAVNRYWQRLFGVGLVKSSEDFGFQGEHPSHPDLLDWLAGEFIRSDWNVKELHRLIMNSATYRQSSHVGRAGYERDPDNRLLARGPRMRLDGEEIRDGILAASGLLVRRMGGKSVYPYQPNGLWLELNNRPGYSKTYQRGTGSDLYRRSIYTFWKRTVPSPMLKTFDAPEREFCTIRRSRTNTPLQALLLLNGPQFVEAARHLGKRMLTEAETSTDARIVRGFRLVTGRKPKPTELAILREALADALKRYKADPDQAGKVLAVGDSPNDAPLDRASWAAYTELARLLLNLNEAITKG